MDFRCPSCRGTDWFYICRDQRHLVKCQSCGQVRVLLVRPLPQIKRSALLHLFPPADALEGEPDSETLAQNEYNLILRTLKKVHWRIEGPSGAADLLRVHPSTLRSRMKKLGISRPKIENAARASH